MLGNIRRLLPIALDALASSAGRILHLSDFRSLEENADEMCGALGFILLS